jgi:hypothetical protein
VDKSITVFLDSQIKSYLTLAEDIILFANGDITPSFLSILSAKKEYQLVDHTNIDPFEEEPQKQTSNLEIYETLSCFVALGQEDYDKFALFGNGFASVLGEQGSRENPPVEKLNSVLLLAKGGELPDFEEDSEQERRSKNQYAELFKTMFGINWKGMIALHKMLTLP